MPLNTCHLVSAVCFIFGIMKLDLFEVIKSSFRKPKQHRLFDMYTSQMEIRACSDSPCADCLLHEAALPFEVGSRDLFFLHYDLCTSPLFRGFLTALCRDSACCGTVEKTWSSIISKSHRNLGSGPNVSRYPCEMRLATITSVYTTCIAYRWK